MYLRRHSGERTCKEHFIRSIEKRVRKEVSKHLTFDSVVGLAISGGKDSLAMAYIMGKLQKKFSKMVLIGLIVDEGIRGYRKPSIEKAEKALSSLGIERKIFSFEERYSVTVDEMVKDSGEKRMACTFCGVLRRRAIDILAKEAGVDIILTGHNVDDISQTILLNIVQGNITHLTERIDFPEVVPRRRPLRNILEKETTLYAFTKGIDYYSAPCPYTSYALRNDIRNFITHLETYHSGTTYSITRSAEKLKTDKVKKRRDRCPKCGYPTLGDICKTCQILERFKRSIDG